MQRGDAKARTTIRWKGNAFAEPYVGKTVNSRQKRDHGFAIMAVPTTNPIGFILPTAFYRVERTR